MKYFSTNKQAPVADFKEATLRGQAPDKGLYFPGNIVVQEHAFFRNIEKLKKEEIAFRIISPYVGDTIPEDELRRIAAETVDFEFPLVKVTDDIYSLELFHGPTLAFKDVGARFMSRCLGYFSKERSDKVTVLVATSGDTGGAVAGGFLNVEGVEVIILYPSGKVSLVQEQQLTAPGGNIHALEVDGSFDDCQRMVKEAFSDEELNRKMFLTSANSINVARWLPQQFYYFFAYQQWQWKDQPPVISVPSGNFGNICAGLLAFRSGLPVKHFIAACNANDVVPEYFRGGGYNPQPAKATISNAMDVGNPSNFIRMLELFDHQYGALREMISAYSISDDETRDTIVSVKKQNGYLTDPHGAVAYASLKKWMTAGNAHAKSIFLETAHPIKFYDVVEPVIGEKVPMPEAIAAIMDKKKVSIRIGAEYPELKDFLLRSK
jgi:threonine synthase